MREVTECIVHVINQQQPPPIEQCASASYAKRFYPSYRISPHKWSHYRFSNLNERRLVRALPITLQTLLERATLNMYRVIMTIEPGKRNTAFKRCRFCTRFDQRYWPFPWKKFNSLASRSSIQMDAIYSMKVKLEEYYQLLFFCTLKEIRRNRTRLLEIGFHRGKGAFACLKGIYIYIKREGRARISS